MLKLLMGSPLEFPKTGISPIDEVSTSAVRGKAKFSLLNDCRVSDAFYGLVKLQKSSGKKIQNVSFCWMSCSRISMKFSCIFRTGQVGGTNMRNVCNGQGLLHSYAS